MIPYSYRSTLSRPLCGSFTVLSSLFSWRSRWFYEFSRESVSRSKFGVVHRGSLGFSFFIFFVSSFSWAVHFLLNDSARTIRERERGRESSDSAERKLREPAASDSQEEDSYVVPDNGERNHMKSPSPSSFQISKRACPACPVTAHTHVAIHHRSKRCCFSPFSYRIEQSSR